ncbi:NADPH-dependent FMN reductase [Cupriavidus basilensis]|uniref:NADPH-dependent FMN reductase n=1 Tax=Cupriavidus basilensis TaxID=68895 RepID=UPI00075123D3|nr:NADPH-dependent FMN reductase [Cupriavidus basilensis]
MSILTLSGSPSAPSRSGHLLTHLRGVLEAAGERTSHLALRELPPAALLAARVDDPEIAAAARAVAEAQVVILATPVYKAAYSGLLKTFLDLLPQTGLRDKVVLPIATGGSLAHTLAIDYALRPVLSALGARHILPGIFAVDQQIAYSETQGLSLDPALDARLAEGVLRLREALAHARIAVPLDLLPGTAASADTSTAPAAFARAAARPAAAGRCSA